ncbi:MAG TPA: hypothetical protein VFV95_18385 [Vicinamibacterales bacterium]|nr:hypothetical protein [Vicinamibacterales bacterium]
MQRSTLRRRLIQVAAVSSLAAIALALTPGFELHAGPLRVSVHSPRHLLMLAVVSAIAAWAVSLAQGDDEGPPGPRRWGRFAALSGLMVVGLNVLMLAQPSMPTDKFYCMEDRPIGKGFRHVLNCDSGEFMALASAPASVVSRRVRQSRPLSFVLAYVISRPLYLIPRLVKAGPYYPLAPEFVAYLIINIALLILTLVIFTRLLDWSARVRDGTELLFALVVLGVNDITKLFFWTPHVQVYNLFIGCLTLYLIVRLIERGEPLRSRQAVGLGLAFGVGLLIYGSFLIPLLCVALVQVVIYRRLWPALVAGAVSLLPYVCWVTLIFALTGTFYNHEIEVYRQFVWIADCAKLGVVACPPKAIDNAWAFFNTGAPVMVVPLLLLCGCRIAGYIWPGNTPVPPERLRLIGLAIAFAFSVTAVFLLLMGYYVPRLIWLLVPSVLLAVTLELRALRLAIALPRRWMFDAGLLAASLVYVFVLLERQGPYN